MHIELGDIIKINSPDLSQYHENIFLVTYIDNNNLQIKNIVTNSDFSLLIENNIIVETSILSIDILKKHQLKGFILQNELNIGSWLDIQFDVELPFILTGKIINTDEDMIEIQVFDNEISELSDDIIFIDFAYKGIPKELSIKEIILREKPNVLETIEDDRDNSVIIEQTILNQVLIDTIDIDKILEQAEDLEDINIRQVKNIENRKFGLGSQINDIIDDLLAIYNNPTKQQLEYVHTLTTRYKELYIKYISYSSKSKFFDNELIYYNWITPIIINKPLLYDIEPNNDLYRSKENNIDINDTIKIFNNLYLDSSIEDKNNLLLKYIADFNSLNDDSIITNNIYSTNLINRRSVILDNTDFNNIESYFVDVTQKDLHIIKSTDNYEKIGINKYFNSFIAKPNDNIKIKSLLFLPLSYSLVNSIKHPTSNILFRSLLSSKVDMSQYSYLNKNMIIKSITNNLSKEKKDELKKIYDESFLKKYIYLQNELSIDQNIDDYFKSIELSISNIINIALNFLSNNNLSLYSVLKELNKFNIDSEFINSYYNDLITANINDKIIAYKQNLLKMKTLKITDKDELSKTLFDNLINDNVINYLDEYQDYTTSELISRLINLDNMNNFIFSILSKQINILDIKNLHDNTVDYLNESSLNLKLKKCEKYYLAKKYSSLEELASDNEITEVLFDRDLDPTNYNLLNDELKSRSKDAIDFLIEKYKFSKSEAKNEYDAIVKNKRLVREGHYALLENNNDNKIFIRNKNNIWELTNKFNGISGSNIFCNFQQDCFKLKKGACSSINEKAKENKINMLTDMLGDIDKQYLINKENFKEYMINNYIYSLSKLKRNIIHSNNLLVNDNNKLYTIGLTYVADDYTVSPFYDIFQSILLIESLQDKYELLIKFCNKYTRSSNLHLSELKESSYWKYCIKTNIKLVPMFLLELAISFVTNNTYGETIRKICKQQGTISDDGDKIVDMYSGYKIKDLELQDDSFFSAPLESDILSSEKNKINITQFKLISKNYIKYIINIVEALTKQIYIEFSVEIKELIIKNVSEDFISININPDKKFAEKQLEMLEIYYITYLTVSYLIIFISTNVPSFKAKKQFPGCIKSFNGWPINDKSDNTLVDYISCVIFNIKIKSHPWKIFSNKSLHSNKIITQETISNKIEYFIESYLLDKSFVQSKITNKIKNLHKDIEDKYDQYNLQLWSTFLPPQQKLKINFKISKNYTNLTKSELLTKSLYHSIIFFHKLQSLIESNITLLSSTLVDPTLSQINNNVNIYDTIVDKDITEQLSSLVIVNDLYNSSIYNKISNGISIYKSYSIHKLNILDSLMKDINMQHTYLYKLFMKKEHRPFLLTIFTSLPSIKIIKSFNSQILVDEFKSNSIVFDEKIFFIVFNYINFNKLNNYLSDIPISETDILSRLQVYISRFIIDNRTDTVDDIFIDIITDITQLNSSDKKFSSLIDNINDKMFLQISNFKDVIIEFIMTNVEIYKYNEKKNITEFIDKYLDSFKDGIFNFWSLIRKSEFNLNIYSTIEEESLKYIINYNANALYNLISLMPNIIINNLKFTKINIPEHWDLSDIHNTDISNFIKKSFIFTKNYDDCRDSFKKLLLEVDDLTMFIKNIVDNVLNNLDNMPFKFQYLFLQYLLCYYIIKLVNIIDNDDIELIQCISTYLFDFFNFIGPNNTFKYINVSYDNNIDIINRVKESEKNKITDMLKDMSKEQRRVDDEFKQYGLGFWSKGKEKGLRIHQNDKYDNDRLDELDDKDDFISSLHGDIFDNDNDIIDDTEAIDMSDIPDDDEYNDGE